MHYLETIIKSAIEREATRQRSEEQSRKRIRPINAQKLDVELGQRVYSYCQEECGLLEWVVVNIDSDGYPLIAPLGGRLDEPFYSTYCTEEYASIAEAMERTVERDLAYYLPRIARLQQIKRAIDANQDLSPFYGTIEKA